MRRNRFELPQRLLSNFLPSGEPRQFGSDGVKQYVCAMILPEDIETCSALVAEIDQVAHETGGYDAQRRWVGPHGLAVHGSRSWATERPSAEFLKGIPSLSSFFTGWPAQEGQLTFAGRALWGTVGRLSPVLGAKIHERWWHRLSHAESYGGPTLSVAEAIAEHHARRLPPALRGPATFDGTVLDRAAALERLRALHRARVLRHLFGNPTPIILEIGAGYGALALALKYALPMATYVIIDLPDSLALSGCYLTTRQSAPVIVAAGEPLLPGSIALCPATALDRLPSLSIDLAINTLSFAEMAEVEVERYARFLAPRLSPGGVLFEQNYDNSQLGPAFCDPGRALARHFAMQRRVPGLYLRGVPRVWSMSDPLQ